MFCFVYLFISPTLSPDSLRSVVLSLLPEESEIGTKALENATAAMERYTIAGSEVADFSALGLKLPREELRAMVLESAVFHDDQASEVNLDATLVFFAGLMEGVYGEFLQMVEDLAQLNVETNKREIGEQEIAAAWAAKLSEWSALFVVRGSHEEEEEEVQAVEAIIKEEAQYLLKIIMVQEQGTVTKLLKVESSMTRRVMTPRDTFWTTTSSSTTTL